jgi:ankyrin repeat protein
MRKHKDPKKKPRPQHRTESSTAQIHSVLTRPTDESFGEFRDRFARMQFGDDNANILYHAVFSRSIPRIEQCLVAGANINSKLGSTSAPLYLPKFTDVSFGIGDLPRMQDTTFGETPLYLAARLGYEEIVNFLLDKGAIIDCDCNHGLTPLFAAIIEGHISTVALLLNRGANAKQTIEDNSTPLHFAVEYNREQIVDLLLAHGANPNATDNDGETPLIVAAEHNGNAQIMERLLSQGAEVNKAKPNGVTPLFLAAQGGYIRCIHTLLSHGANINVLRTTDNMSPLQIAACEGHLTTVKLLVNNGAKLDHKCVDKRTALVYAEGNGFRHVAEYLLHAQEQHKAAVALNQKAIQFYEQKNYHRALELFIQALHAHRQLHGNLSVEVAVTCYNLGSAYREIEDYEASVNSYTESVNVYTAIYGESHSQTIKSRQKLEEVYERLQNKAYDYKS